MLALLVLGCGDEGGGGGAIDAGLDAPRRLALTVDGPPAVAATRSLKVTIVANGITRSDTFVVGGLPTTVDVPQPIQLSDWSITVDGFDASGTLLGRGASVVPAGTSATMIALAPI